MTDQADDWLTQLQKKMTATPAPSPKQAAEYAVERHAESNTRWEWAHLNEDGKISVRISVNMENGGHGTSEFVVAPGEDTYEECLREYGLKVSGDTRSIKKRFIDGIWTDEINHNVNTENENL